MDRLTLIIISFIIAGCSAAPIVRYPDFPEQKKNINSTIILTDVSILTSMINDTNCIDLVENTRLAKECLLLLAGKLNAKGYHVDRTLFTSSGLLMNKSKLYRIIKFAEERDINENLLNIVSPPFYLHNLFSQDTIRRQLLELTYSSVINYQKKKGDKNKFVPAATYLGKSLGGGMLAIIFFGGNNVGAVNQYGKYELPKSMTEEKIGIQKISQFMMMFYLIDSSTGEVLWDDRTLVKSGLMQDEKLQRMIEKITDELP